MIPITWGRYWMSATMHYRCPKCRKASRLVTRPRGIQFASWAAQVLPIGSLLVFGFELWIWLALVPTYVVLVLIDKRMDERFGVLVGPSPSRRQSQQDVDDGLH